jgi:hypothetical protein
MSRGPFSYTLRQREYPYKRCRSEAAVTGFEIFMAQKCYRCYKMAALAEVPCQMTTRPYGFARTTP